MAKCLFRRLFCVVLAFFTVICCDAQQALLLNYDHPAKNWNEALPLGNGRLGAMVFGGVDRDRLQLNEETVWAGEPGNNIPSHVYDSIVQIRKLLFMKRYKAAQDMSNRVFPRNAPSNSNYGMPYQPVGDLFIKYKNLGHYQNYHRVLNISDATAQSTFEVSGVHYKREVIASFADNVIIIRLTADKKGALNCELLMESPQLQHKVSTTEKTLVLKGHSGNVDNKKGKVRFTAIVKPVLEGGTLESTDSSLNIQNADAVTVYISIGTNFNNYHDISADPNQRAADYLQRADVKPYKQALAEHKRIYHKYFDRIDFQLETPDTAKAMTDARVKNFDAHYDPSLVALYFQFGRYLLISSSQPGGQPANLQGIWNDKIAPPWDSKYTININTEMNYWPAEVTDLPEMAAPLFSMIKDLSVTGRQSARKMYHARGWNAHHNTDLWRITGPVDGGFYGMWPMGGAWLSTHLWQHFLYSGDTGFLKKNYRILKGAALYFVDALQQEPDHHYLVVAPSMSPEHQYMSGVGLSAGTTMDNQLVFDVFSQVIAASRFLNQDKLFADTLKTLIKRLPPMQVGQYGQLQEWLQDWDKQHDTHRHISHLYGLFPSNQISPYEHPALFAAAKKTLISRGDVSTGWSMGWKVNWWARMKDGNHSWKLILDQLRPAPEVNKGEGGGTYPNLFDAHPPFQIDGNFGCTSGIAEMLLQSQDGALEILPALPDQWQKGSIKGLMGRGGFKVDIEWSKGQVTRLKIQSAIGGNCRLRLPAGLRLRGKEALFEVPANSSNPNPYYKTAAIKKPLISEKAKARELTIPAIPPTKCYDFKTIKGGVYVFYAVENS